MDRNELPALSEALLALARPTWIPRDEPETLTGDLHRLIRLQRDRDDALRVITLLLKELGGETWLSDADLTSAPPGKLQTVREGDGIRLAVIPWPEDFTAPGGAPPASASRTAKGFPDGTASS